MDLPTTQPASSGLLQLEAGTLLANTPVGVYRHQLRAVREKLRLEVARADQYCAEAQLARDQLKAEIEARNSIQVVIRGSECVGSSRTPVFFQRTFPVLRWGCRPSRISRDVLYFGLIVLCPILGLPGMSNVPISAVDKCY